MKKLLFIYPTMVTEAPLSLAMLSAAAKQVGGWETHACVNTFKKPLSIGDFVKAATEFQADIVGISMITFEVLWVYELVAALKKAGFMVIAGGAHPTDCPQECFDHGIDAVIVGEGEEVLKDILTEYPYIRRGIRERKPYIPDLDTLPDPDLDVFDIELFRDDTGFIKGFHRVYSSRGCPAFCTFCDWQVFKQCWRSQSVPKIIAEVKRRSREYGISVVGIADDCFTVDHNRVYEFCKEIVKVEPRIEWRASSRANLVDLSLLQAMKAANCFSVAYGIESGDAETLKKMAKQVTVEENIRAPKLAHEAGLEVYACLMVGFPWESPESIQNQIDYVHAVWDDVSLFQVSGSLIPFPGTAIYKKYHKQYGFTEFWLRPEYQEYGIQIYQNALNPLRFSCFYQRYFFDDTYIKEERFFTYTKAYKKKVKELVIEIGKHNLIFMFPGQKFKQKLILFLGRISMVVADIFPELEKTVGGFLFEVFSKNKKAKIELLRDKRRGIAKVRK